MSLRYRAAVNQPVDLPLRACVSRAKYFIVAFNYRVRALRRRDDYGAKGAILSSLLLSSFSEILGRCRARRVLPEVFAKGQGERTRAQRTRSYVTTALISSIVCSSTRRISMLTNWCATILASRVLRGRRARSHEIRFVLLPLHSLFLSPPISLSFSLYDSLSVSLFLFLSLSLSASLCHSLSVCLSVLFFPCGCYISDWWLLTRYSLGITNDLAVISRDACVSLSLCNDGTGGTSAFDSL